MKIRYLCWILAFFPLLGCVEPQKFVALENRVAAMEMENARQLSKQKKISQASIDQNRQDQLSLKKQLATLSEKIQGSHLISKEEYANLKYEIDAIQKKLQRLEGAIQEIHHRIDGMAETDRKEIETQLERLDSAISKNYEKIIALEKHMGFEPSTGGGLVSDVADPGEVPLADTEESIYARAKKLFDDREMENARIAFENFIAKYPESDNADNARYWIADSYYVEKRYAEAILEYQKVLETYPKSNKLAAARLKQGYAFAELGEFANARLILKELLKKFPDSQEATYAQEKLKGLK